MGACYVNVPYSVIQYAAGRREHLIRDTKEVWKLCWWLFCIVTLRDFSSYLWCYTSIFILV